MFPVRSFPLMLEEDYFGLIFLLSFPIRLYRFIRECIVIPLIFCFSGTLTKDLSGIILITGGNFFPQSPTSASSYAVPGRCLSTASGATFTHRCANSFRDHQHTEHLPVYALSQRGCSHSVFQLTCCLHCIPLQVARDRALL